MLTDLELGWLVGILEGEGSFGCRYIENTLYRSVKVSMTDEDIIYRYCDLVQKVTGKRHNVLTVPKPGNRQEQYMVHLASHDAIKVLKLVIPHLGFRRRKRAWQVINGFIHTRGNLDVKAVVAQILSTVE